MEVPEVELGETIVGPDDLLLITGANGFIGNRVVDSLIRSGFRNVRCFVRPSGNLTKLEKVIASAKSCRVEILKGNLLSRGDCMAAVEGAAVIYHLAAGIEKTFPGCYLNSVVTTRNLVEAALQGGSLRRFVNVSSFAVYSNIGMKRRQLLDESCPLETRFMERHEAYCFGKTKQDQIVEEYGKARQLPYVIARPGAVYGPGNSGITARVGIDTFGFFLHLGGSNIIPLTYVDNCADAIALAGIRPGIDGEVFNIVDDDLPTSRSFLKQYKRNVAPFRSVYVPYRVFYALCFLWEKYSSWSEGQLPPAFNRRRCSAYWKGNRYSNEKMKSMLGWKHRIPFAEASRDYFEAARCAKVGKE